VVKITESILVEFNFLNEGRDVKRIDVRIWFGVSSYYLLSNIIKLSVFTIKRL
jgi:hypothetical protein